MSIFKPLDLDARFQTFFGIKKHSKVLEIKGFIIFGAGTTQLYLVEISLFQPLILAISYHKGKIFFTKIINLGFWFYKILILDTIFDPMCQKSSLNTPYLTLFMPSFRSEIW